MIRKATQNDIDAIEHIYNAIHEQERKGAMTVGWLDGVYPVRATAQASLDRDDMYVYDDGGKILAAGIINKTQVDVYYGAKWSIEADDRDVLVLHTLVVDPASCRRGIGSAFAKYYESYARESGCKVLRIDTNARNAAARKMYARLGYREADIVPCEFNGIPGVQLVLLEKAVSAAV